MQSILIVTSAATSFNLTTAAAVRQELSIAGVDDDLWINGKLPRASAAAATYCGRILARQTYSQMFRTDYECSRMLFLREYPVTSITSVIEDGVTLATTDYEIEAETGILYRLCSDQRVPWIGCKVTVVFVAGYVLPGGVSTLPNDIEDATIALMKSAYMARQKDPALKSYEVPGVVSETYWIAGPGDESGNLPPEVTSLLDPHRRPYA